MDHLAVILLMLAASAMFSGVEIAFVSADRLQIEVQRQRGQLSGRILSVFLNNPSRFISTTLIGNTVSLVVYGIYFAALLEPKLEEGLPAALNNDISVLTIQTVASTLLVLITAEFTPKSLFLRNPNWMLGIFALPMAMVYYVAYPVVFLVEWLSRLLIKYVLRFDVEDDQQAYRLTDLGNFVSNILPQQNGNGVEEGPMVDSKIFSNALEFKTVRVRECMIPRTEIVAVDLVDGMEELKKAFIESRHTKVLIYKESIDDIIGYAHSQELFKKPKRVQDMLTPILIVPETMLANELMIQFITERKSLALVVDEFGGTSGIVSMEDIIEEIFGEIQDEHDDEELVEEKIDDNTYHLSARHEIDYLNEQYGWELPEGDYDTLGGLVISITEDIPEQGQQIVHEHLTIRVTAMEENRIDTVELVFDPAALES